MSAEGIGISSKTDPSGHFLYIAEILGRAVVSSTGKTIGRLRDLKVRLTTYPPIVGLSVRKGWGKKVFELEWSRASAWTRDGPPGRTGRNGARPVRPEPTEIWLRKNSWTSRSSTRRSENRRSRHPSAERQPRPRLATWMSAGGDFSAASAGSGTDGQVNLWLVRLPGRGEDISWKYVQPLLSDPIKKSSN